MKKITMEEAWANSNYRNILNKACSGFYKFIDEDDILSLQMETLWTSLKKYNPNLKMKFTSYLYQMMHYKLLDHVKCMKRKNKFKNVKFIEAITPDRELADSSLSYDYGINEIIKDLGEEGQLIADRYIYQKTFREMSLERKESMTKVKRKVKKALQKTEELFS